MNNKTVHIIGAGGAAGIGMTRCLKDNYTVTGEDSSEWGLRMMECPIGDFSARMLIPVPDISIDSLTWCSKCFLPNSEQVCICQDKEVTAELLGDLAPKTYWLRDTHGAGGSGAQMLSNYLPGANYSCEFVFRDGLRLTGFQKRRISYSVKETTQGIDNRGSSAVSICTNWHQAWEVAQEALHLLPGTLNGFYGVDLKCDENNVPKVTEINAGRLLTASYSYYWLTGFNLPLLGVAAFLGDELPVLPEYPEGYGIIRQIDQLPKLFTPEETQSWIS